MKNRDVMVVKFRTQLTAAILFDNEILYKKAKLEALASCDLALEFKTDYLAKENSDVSAS